MNQRGRTAFIISFLAPATILYFGLVVWPLLQAFQFSAYQWRGVSSQKKFVGMENFQKLSEDAVFLHALKNNLWVLVVGGVVTITLAIALAHALQGQGRAKSVLRGLMLFPQAISLVVVAILWTFIFNPTFGLLTSGLKAIGLEGITRPWLGDSHTALPCVTVAFVWFAIGFYILLFSAGLRTIDAEINEAAELDGALGWTRFKTITWPLLWSVKRIAIVHLVIAVMNIFALVYLMTQGGPDRHTEMMLTYLYERAFKDSQFGPATAIAAANFVVAMALGGLVMFWLRKNPTERRA